MSDLEIEEQSRDTDIRGLFSRPVDRHIDEVINVESTREENVAAEIDEYVATAHIRQRLEDVLDAYHESITKPSERTNIWVSGRFGSGKSHFSKVLGYLVENPTVDGHSAADRFREASDAPKVEALLNSIHVQAHTTTIYVNLHTERRSDEADIALLLYRKLLERLGYSSNPLLAELEFGLEEDGELTAFEVCFRQASSGKPWDERKRLAAFALSEASAAMHLLRPETFPTTDSWKSSAQAPDVTPRWFAVRAIQLLERRGKSRRALFVVDEVQQHVVGSTERMLDLKALAVAIARQHGQLWMLAIGQTSLDDDNFTPTNGGDYLDRLIDRFPIRVHLLTSDIEEITSHRLLAKTTAGQAAIREQLSTYREGFIANTRLKPAGRWTDPTDDEILSWYPLVPSHVQLLIETDPVQRHQGGASVRTVSKLVQQLVVDVGECPVGAIASIDRAYDMLEHSLPRPWQATVREVAERYSHDGLEIRTVKTIALCAGVVDLPLCEENVAALLHPSFDAESILEAVKNALANLEADGQVFMGGNGYELLAATDACGAVGTAANPVDRRPAAELYRWDESTEQ